MSYYEKLVLWRLQWMYAAHLSPVRTLEMTIYIPKNERLIRGWLTSLKKKGYVNRVGSRRSGGWKPTTIPAGIGALVEAV